jgi:hypothetical protein
MTKSPSIRRLLTFLPLALLLLLPASTSAADTYESTWNGGHLTATANADFTEATIESVSVSSDQCGTNPNEATCAWEALATLHSSPESRCNPATPEEQVVWESGLQPGNGTVEDGPVSFPLEGCRGQTLEFEVAVEKTYKEGPIIWSRQGGPWTLFTFGYHPVEEIERQIIEANTAPPPPPPPAPVTLTVASDCRSLTIGNVSYVFTFRRMGCTKASNLAKMRNISGQAPSAYNCRNLKPSRGVLCWREGHPEKYLEWRLPGTKPGHAAPR